MPNQPSPREETIIDLLRLYRDFQGVSKSGDRIGGGSNEQDGHLLYMDGGGSLELPGGIKVTWEGSGCDKLDGCLVELREFAPKHWRCVTERYLRCEVRKVRVKLARTRSGKTELPKPPAHMHYLGLPVRPSDSWLASEAEIVVESWPAWVRRHRVELGIKFLAARFPWDEHRWADLTHATAA